MTTTALERRPAWPARCVEGTLGAAAERFARLTLKKSQQTQATYAAAYARFARWLAAHEQTADLRPEAFTADALAAYLAELELTKAPRSRRSVPLSTAWPSTSTSSGRSTPPRSS